MIAASRDQFIDHLLSQMTLDEKIGQLHQANAESIDDPEIFRQGRIGSLLNTPGPSQGQSGSAPGGAELINLLQQKALESRLKIPLIIGRDVIHGYRTIFPIPLAQAAAFNPDLSEKAAAIAAQEASADGTKWTFAPMLDIARDPRWGRVAEGNGEDPFLGTQLAASLVRGFQGVDMAASNKLVACAKHYVGYGSVEGGRDYENGEISEPTLRDVYLPPFESAVRAGVGTVMSAFIDLNGIPATANRRLLTDVLRDEWGFDGFVVSDWASIAELVQHGIAEDIAQAASIALHAGIDMDMVSEAYLGTLVDSLHAGRLPIEEVDEAVRRILRVKQRAGLFEHPYTDPSRFDHEILTTESRIVARQFARECMVLLKNQGDILPLRDFRKIMVAGNFVHAQSELFGTWSLGGRHEDAVPLLDGLREVAPKNVDFIYADNPDSMLRSALQADVVLLVLGEAPSRSGENSNVSDLGLPSGQAEFVDFVVNIGKPVVLVVFAGRPLAISRQIAQVEAVLYAWHPGIEGGAALGEILFGIHAPSGRLPITFPRATGQVPVYYNHKNSGRPLSGEGWFITRYLDLLPTPLFPFGYGLSYTKFDYTDLQLSHQKIHDQIKISADITNTGMWVGCELVQLYVRDLVGSLTRPVRELKGFQQVELRPGESRRVAFTLTEEMLGFTRADGSKGTEPGRFQVWIAPDSSSGISTIFHL